MLKATSIRRVVDLWGEFASLFSDLDEQDRSSTTESPPVSQYQSKHFPKDTTEIRPKVLDVIRRHCLDTLQEEHAFSVEQRNTIKTILGTRLSYVSDLEQLPVQVSADVLHGSKISGYVDDSPRSRSKTDCRVRYYSNQVWKFKTDDDGKERPGYPLSHDAAAIITLLHDLLALAPESTGETSPWLDNPQARKPLITSQWSLREKSTELEWPTPPYVSFLEHDLFTGTWFKILEGITSAMCNQASVVATLAHAWIHLGTCIMDGQIYSFIQNYLRGSLKWEKLAQQVEALINKRDVSDSEAERNRLWLINIALLMMPETGVPPQVLSEFWLLAKALQGFIREDDQAETFREKRAYRLDLIGKQGMSRRAGLLRKAGSFSDNKAIRLPGLPGKSR